MRSQPSLSIEDHGLVVSSAFPNARGVGGVKSQVEDMRRVMPFAGNPTRQRRRKLRINQEIHAGCKTA
jgi:hypothetical protein